MINRDPMGTPEDFVKNNFRQNEDTPTPNPGFLKTGYDSFRSAAVDGVAHDFSMNDDYLGGVQPSMGKEQREAAKDYFNMLSKSIHSNVDDELNNPQLGSAQKFVNGVASMIGGLTELPSLATGGVGGGLAKGGVAVTSFAARKLAPELVEKAVSSGLSEGTKNLLAKVGARKLGNVTAGGIAEANAVGFGYGAGAAVPEALKNDVDKDTGKYQIGKIVSDMAVSGTFGMVINSLVYAHGVLRETSPTIERTPDEKEFLANPSPELASKILAKRGIDVNAVTHEVPIPIVSADDVNKMSSGTFDQLNSNLDGDMKNTLSDFLVSKGLSELAANENHINGMRGFVDFIKKRSENNSSVTSSFDQLLDKKLNNQNEANETLRDIRSNLLDDGLPDKHLSSQSYRDLSALAPHNRNAAMLKSRVDLEAQINKEEAFSKMAQNLIDMADNADDVSPKPGNVADYLKAKNDDIKPTDTSRTKALADQVESIKKVPTDPDIILDQQKELNKVINSPTQKKEFDKSASRMKEFKENPNIFSNLIKCILGSE